MSLRTIEEGLIAAISDAGLGLDTVRGLSTADLNEQTGDLVVIPSAALVVFAGSEMSSRDLGGLTYEDEGAWQVVVVTEDLSGNEGARRSAYDIVDAMKDVLAGLKIGEGGDRTHITLSGVEVVQVTSGRAVYSLTLEASGHFQKT